MTQRDTFIDDLFKIAKNDKDVIMISVDMGASALDQWRDELPNQFFATGISEQHTINFAAGLSAQGKKVYVYFMASWVARCAPTEDIAYMRSLIDIEIYTPHNINLTKTLVDKSYEERTLKYIRLERNYDTRLDNDTNSIGGISVVKPGLWSNPNTKDQPKIALVSSGYILGRCLDVWEKLQSTNYEVSLYNLYRAKPNPINQNTFDDYTHIVSVEEQTLSGGVGSVILEGVSDVGQFKKVLRLGLPERYIFENGNRDYHLNNNGLSIDDIISKVKDFVYA